MALSYLGTILRWQVPGESDRAIMGPDRARLDEVLVPIQRGAGAADTLQLAAPDVARHARPAGCGIRSERSL